MNCCRSLHWAVREWFKVEKKLSDWMRKNYWSWLCLSLGFWDPTLGYNVGLQRPNFSRYDTYLDTSTTILHMIQYIINLRTTDRWRRAAKNGQIMCFVHGRRGLSRLTTNWNCACFCAANLKDICDHNTKYRWNLFSFHGSLCLINSSERAWT